MLGAAIGGIALGNLGDRIGRTRAMGVCILFYSVFAALGAYAQTQEQMLVLRFLVGLGVGGLWPNGIALVSECWAGVSRPLVSGAMMAGLNAGILLLSQLARHWPITPDSWRWVFQFAGAPALLGIFVLIALPESPKWLASRGATKGPVTPLRELFQPQLIRFTLVGIFLSAIPMVGAWSASKWMIPWSDKVAGSVNVGYKAATQGWWALGATLGSFAGAQLAGWLGRRLSYFLISIATVVTTVAMFQLTAPLAPSFHPVVFTQGFVATLFFGWLALYLPELFPTRVRATGSGLAYNSGRFATAFGVLAAGFLFSSLGGDYPRVGTICALIYALGIIVIWWAPDTGKQELAD
jgi:SHS family sialic acid transporter-like MFS transporter